MVRVYEAWKGNNRFVCGGRFILGPDWKSFILTLFLISAPAIVFWIFPGRELVNRLSPAVLVISVLFIIWDLAILILTSTRDPGVIPRNLEPPLPDEDPENPPNPYEYPGHRSSRLPRTKDIVVNGVTVKVKYCDTCMLYRPPRTSHCSICNNCVERFDHHCPWVGQCIGKRNYRYFYLFVFSTTLLCVYVFAFSAVNIKLIMDEKKDKGQSGSVLKAMADSPASVVLMAYTFIAIWFVGGLTVFHSYLIATNQTTYENFRYRYDNKANPYNTGCLKNCGDVFCTPVPPSRNDFRAEAPLPRPPPLELHQAPQGVPQEIAEREAAYKLSYVAANGGGDAIVGPALPPQGYGSYQGQPYSAGHHRSYSEVYSDADLATPMGGPSADLSPRATAHYHPSDTEDLSTLPTPGNSPPQTPITNARGFYRDRDAGDVGRGDVSRGGRGPEIEMARGNAQ